MIIKASSKNYTLTIHENFSFIEDLLAIDNTMFVIDEKVYQLYYKELFSSIPDEKLYLMQAVEQKKNIDTALEICEIMTSIPAKRNAHLISFGGGIVQDVTGFVANILYRGIHWTFVPTTLLAACDSCIGGKTSLNYKKYKNLLGTFFPPDDIHICPLFFDTLSEADYESGLGEVVKFNLMYGEEGLNRIEKDIEALLKKEKGTLNQYVKSSLLFKKDFIEEDEFDRGVRIHLNFAHTFGHAFESVTDYAIPHGTAVAMGMIVADRISLERGWLAQDTVERMEDILFKIIHVEVSNMRFDMDAIIAAIRKDKKQTSKELTAVLMHDDMKLKIVKDLKAEEAQRAVQYVIEKLVQK